MERQPIDSSMFRSMGYDPMTQTLEVEYKSNGYVERFPGVTQDEYQALASASSIGKHFHRHIKPHHTGTKAQE